MPRIPIPFYNERQTAASGPFLDANAQGGRLGDFAGQADQELGSGLGEVAQIARKREEDQAYAWSTSAASKFKVDQFQKLQQAKDNAPVGGDGLTKQYLDSYDQDAQTLMQSAPTARARHFLDLHLSSFRTVMGEQSIREEYVLGKSYLASSAQDAVNSSAQLIGAPGGDRSRFQSELDTQLSSIAKLSLPPDVKQQLTDHARKTLTDAYWTSYVRDDPQGAATLLRGQQPIAAPGETSPQQAIRDAAKAQGLDPHTALAVASIESRNFNPADKNPNSSATGLFGITGSTWNDLGGTDANRGDVTTQAQLGVKNVAQNARALRDSLKRDLTPGEIYSTQWGLGFAGSLAKAPDSMPVSEVFARARMDPAKTMAANGLPASMTAGQLRGAFNTQMAQAYARTRGYADAPDSGQAPAPPVDAAARTALANTPIPQQMAYLTHAESMARRDDSQARAAMEGRINDTAAAYANLQDAPNPPSLNELVQTYGAVRGAQQFAHLQDLQSAAHVGAGFATMPTAQIDTILAAQKPAPGEGFADKARVWDNLQGVAQRIKTARAQDPIATDQSIGAKLTQPIDFADDAALGTAMRARYTQAQQIAEDYGTAYTPLSKADAANLAAQVSGLPPPAAAAKLGVLRMAAGGDDAKFGALMAQIAPEHPSLAIAGMLLADNPQAASLIIAGDRILNPGKVDKAQEGKTPSLQLPPSVKFEAAWGAMRGAAFQGLDPDSRAHLNAAMAYYAAAKPAGMRDPKADLLTDPVWKAAVAAVAPVAADLSGRDVLIPAGYDPSRFHDDIAKAWPTTLAQYGLDPKDYPAQAYSLQSAGRDGLYVAYDGGGVRLMANNRPVVLNLTAQPVAPSAPQLPPTLTRTTARESALDKLRTGRR